MISPEQDRLFDEQCGVAEPAQLELLGLTRSQRRTLLNSGVLKELRRGAITTGERFESADFVGRHRLHLAGVLLLRGWRPSLATNDFVGGLRTAAFLHGLPFQPAPAAVEAWKQDRRSQHLSDEARSVLAEVERIRRGEGPFFVDLVSTRRRRTYENFVRTRPATLPAHHVVLNEGVPITSLARTAVDLMRDGTPADALIAADGALHLGVQRSELEEVAAFCSQWANTRQALVAIASGDGRSESPAESLARFVCGQRREGPEARTAG